LYPAKSGLDGDRLGTDKVEVGHEPRKEPGRVGQVVPQCPA
jgi:hypothetical protein